MKQKCINVYRFYGFMAFFVRETALGQQKNWGSRYEVLLHDRVVKTREVKNGSQG